MNTHPEQPAHKVKRLATTSLILGIFAIIVGAFGLLAIAAPSDVGDASIGVTIVFLIIKFTPSIAGLLLGLASVTTGIRACRQIIKNEKNKKGLVVAIIGITLGIFTCLPLICILTNVLIMMISSLRSLRVLSPDGRWTTYTMANSGLVSDSVNDVAVDGQGRVWAVTGDGLSVLAPDGSWTTFTTDNSDLASDLVNTVAVDDQGGVWIGTDGGLSVLSPDGAWTTYTTDNSNQALNWVYAVAIDGQDRAWVGTDRGLRVLSPDGSWTTDARAHSLANGQVRTVVIDGQGLVYVGTDKGLRVLSPDGRWMTYMRNFPVTSLAFDGQGRVWAGAGGNLSVLDPDGSWMTYMRSNSDHLANEVMALAIDDQDRVWVGAADELSVLSPDGNWTYYRPPQNGSGFYDMAFDNQGRVWVVNKMGGGLSVIDTKREPPFSSPVDKIWPILGAALVLALLVVGVIWIVQRRRARPKRVVAPQPVTPAELGEAIPPGPFPAMPAQTRQAPPEAEEMGDISEF